MKKFKFYDLNYELSWVRHKPIEEQADVLAKVTGAKFDQKGIKQIVSCKMRDIFIVYEDGRVLKNFEPFEETDIDGIFEASSDTYYVIYKSGAVDSLYSCDEATLHGRYDKVLFDECFLLLLKGTSLIVLSWVWGETREGDEISVFSSFDGVEDAKLIHPWEKDGKEPSEPMVETEIKMKIGGKWLTMAGAPMEHMKGQRTETEEEKKMKEEQHEEVKRRVKKLGELFGLNSATMMSMEHGLYHDPEKSDTYWGVEVERRANELMRRFERKTGAEIYYSVICNMGEEIGRVLNILYVGENPRDWDATGIYDKNDIYAATINIESGYIEYGGIVLEKKHYEDLGWDLLERIG